MTDPFEALREPVTPVDPDPGFAERLRQRLTREVFASSPGGSMSQQATASQQPAVEREPAWPPALTPYIMVSDARRAIAWYIDVFGAQRRGADYVNADGTIGHAEVGIGDAVLMLSEPSDLWPDVPVRAPDSPTTFSHTLHLQVDDVDGTTERARSNGASVEREPTDQPYGRGAVIIDLQKCAEQFAFTTARTAAAEAALQGDPDVALFGTRGFPGPDDRARAQAFHDLPFFDLRVLALPGWRSFLRGLRPGCALACCLELSWRLWPRAIGLPSDSSSNRNAPATGAASTSRTSTTSPSRCMAPLREPTSA